MKLLITLPAFLALATAAPTPSSTNLSAVKLRIISTDSNHYSTPNQNPTTNPGRTLSIPVGQTLSLDNDPILAQGFEIVDISEGESLSKQKVGQNDANVYCKASVKFSSKGPKFAIQDQVQTLDEGKVVQVTGLSCGLGEKSV